MEAAATVPGDETHYPDFPRGVVQITRLTKHLTLDDCVAGAVPTEKLIPDDARVGVW